MKAVKAIAPDQKIVVDGRAIVSDKFTFPDDVHAVQWDGEKGHVEYKDSRPNARLTEQSEVQDYIDQHKAEASRLDSEPQVEPWEEAVWDDDEQSWSVQLRGDALSIRKREMRLAARRHSDRVLSEGFKDSDGIRWPATDRARKRVLELTQRIQEHRDGQIDTPLPKGKDKARLWDADGGTRKVEPDKLVELAELGSDFKEDAEDRLEELLESIEAAESHDDLDAIDVESGWP